MAESEAKRIERLKEWHRDAASSNSEWRDRAIESFQFYTGIRQWKPEWEDALRKSGRPMLKINNILPIINMISGYQRQNRTDIKLYPRRGGTVAVAALGTELIKHTLDMCQGQYEMSDMFGDGIVCGKGWLFVDRTYADDLLNGDLTVERVSAFDVIEDQANRKYDVNKCQYVFRRFWWDRDQVELQYPGKTKDLHNATESPEWDGATREVDDDDYAEDIDGVSTAREDRKKRQYEIRECWHKRWEKSVVLLNVETMRKRRVKGEDLKMARAMIASNPMYGQTLRIIERPMEVLYRTLTVGDLELEHEEDPLNGSTRYPFMRFCPYWVDGYIMGVVDNLKDPQRELNKNRSQTLHAMNQTASSGWMVDRIDPEYEKVLARDGAKPGLILDKSKAQGAEKIKPNPLDQGHFVLSERAAKDLKDISGANPDMMGTKPEQTESGKSRMIRQSAGMTVLYSIFDNLKRTKNDIGWCLWDVIRRGNVYSEDEIRAVVEEASLRQFITQNEYGDQVIDLSPMESWQNGRYGVQVDDGQDTPTLRLERFNQMIDAVKAGLPIPPDMLVEMSDWPNKEELTMRIREQMQQEQQQAMVPAGAGR